MPPTPLPRLRFSYWIAFSFFRYCASAVNTRPHHGSSRSKPRLALNTVGSFRLPLSRSTSGAGGEPAGGTWLCGFGLKPVPLVAVVVYSVTPLFVYGFDNHTPGVTPSEMP